MTKFRHYFRHSVDVLIQRNTDANRIKYLTLRSFPSRELKEDDFVTKEGGDNNSFQVLDFYYLLFINEFSKGYD